jgi:hypothetical protein
MTEAWQAREMQQQTFLDELVLWVHEEADKCPAEIDPFEYFIVNFMTAILAHYCGTLGQPSTSGLIRASIVPSATRFFDKVLPKVRAFIRVPSEERRILFLLFEKLERSLGSWSQRTYRAEALTDPMAVYGAPSAMDEVPEQ